MVEGGRPAGPDGQLHRLQVVRVAAVGTHQQVAHLSRALPVEQVRRALVRTAHKDSLRRPTMASGHRNVRPKITHMRMNIEKTRLALTIELWSCG